MWSAPVLQMLMLGSRAASVAAGAMLYSAGRRRAHPSGEAGTSTPQQAGRHDRRMRPLPFPAACRTLCRSRRRALRLAGQRAEAYHWSWCRDVELHLPSDFPVLMMTKTDLRGAAIGGDYRMLLLAHADEVIE